MRGCKSCYSYNQCIEAEGLMVYKELCTSDLSYGSYYKGLCTDNYLKNIGEGESKGNCLYAAGLLCEVYEAPNEERREKAILDRKKIAENLYYEIVEK